MSDGQWQPLIDSGWFTVCRCSHYAMKHELSGRCSATTDLVRCDCRQFTAELKVVE